MEINKNNIIMTAFVTSALMSSNFIINGENISYADSLEYKTINADSVNFRKGPSTSYTSLGKFNKGDVVEYLGKDGSWSKVKYNNNTGYVYSKYVSEVNTVKKYVTASSLNVRSGAGINYSVIKTISKNTQVEVISESNGWAKVKVDSTIGYVSSSYLSSNSSQTTTKKYVTASSLNVRSGAGTNYSVIKTISKNTQVEVISESNGWSKIKVDSITGYVSSTYLSSTQSSTNTESSSTKADRLISYAKKLLGKPYVWGAQGPSSFDCSGFTYYVYKNSANVILPRVSKDQSKYGTLIKKSNLQKGDLVFFDTSGSNNGSVSHVGIYIGSNQFIHASSSKGKVVISSLSSYYNDAFVNARRVL